MSRRNAPGPNFEIIPRDRPLRRLDARGNQRSLEAEQLGPRLQKLYSPPSEQPPEDIRSVMGVLARKFQ